MYLLRFYLVTSILAFILLLSFFASINSYASEQSYTIQIGAFIIHENAHKQFDSLTQKLKENELDYLRIEKSGKFHIVRLGKFEDIRAANRIILIVKSISPDAFIIKDYIRDEGSLDYMEADPPQL